MADTYSLQVIFSVNNIEEISSVFSASADGTKQWSAGVPTDTTNLLVSLGFTLARLKGFLLTSTKAITVKTNSSSAPDETFSVPADGCVAFVDGMYTLFAGDVTAFYITNASGETAVVEIKILEDLTP